MTDTQKQIEDIFNEVKDLVLSKNAQYGDSVLNPVRIFSKAHISEQIRVRMDDKLSRLARGNDNIESDEDIYMDLMGYCAFAVIAIRNEKAKTNNSDD